MRFLLSAVFVLSMCFVRAQSGYAGFTGDFNTGIGERYTYGLGLHVEARVWRCNNLYFNWHYGAGSNTHGEFYGRGGLTVLAYGVREWWGYRASTWQEAAIIVVGPLVVPNGMTYYFPNELYAANGNRVRLGVYCNPIALEYWSMKPYKVTSWTLEAGAKILYYTKNDRVVYLAAGTGLTHNIRPQARGTGYGNEPLVQVQLGILSVVE